VEEDINLGCLPAIERLKRLRYEIIIELEQPPDLRKQMKIFVGIRFWRQKSALLRSSKPSIAAGAREHDLSGFAGTSRG